jgi:hypothetical protein
MKAKPSSKNFGTMNCVANLKELRTPLLELSKKTRKPHAAHFKSQTKELRSLSNLNEQQSSVTLCSPAM